MISNQMLATKLEVPLLDATVTKGQKLEVDNNMTRSIRKSNGRTTDQELSGDKSTPIDDGDYIIVMVLVKRQLQGRK